MRLISPANAATALAALKVLRNEPERVERVNEIANRMRRAFCEMGFDTGNSTTPIVSLFIGEIRRTFITWKLIFNNGVFVNATIPPAVPEGGERLRTSFMASHTEEQLSQVLTAFEIAGKQAGLI